NFDPIAFELFKNAIFSIADEMALTIFRTTYSGVLKDNMDYSTALSDADGKLVAQGLTLPGHLGSVPTAMASIIRHFGAAIGRRAPFSHVTTRRRRACPRRPFSFPSRSITKGNGSPSPAPSATTPTWAAASPARTRPTRPRSTPKACASRR